MCEPACDHSMAALAPAAAPAAAPPSAAPSALGVPAAVPLLLAEALVKDEGGGCSGCWRKHRFVHCCYRSKGDSGVARAAVSIASASFVGLSCPYGMVFKRGYGLWSALVR
jgi:hypothetical protein